jgi:1-deoxy-D-xylulose-5-phosphate synthase
MQNVYRERVFDVGIAEQHAVTFSAGLAASGLIPFCCIYSTFLQRAFDQLIHDVALQNLHVVFAVDRAGLVGEDGPTHHGVFDLSFLQSIPNLFILSPSDQTELRNAMYTAVHELRGPVIIRYPRGGCGESFNPTVMEILPISKSVCLKKTDSDVALISVGTIKKNCYEALDGLDISHYDIRYVKPFDTDLLMELYARCSNILIVEESQQTGGFASTVLLHASENNYKGRIHSIGIKDSFTPQGSMSDLYKHTGLDKEQLRNTILSSIKSTQG